MVSLNYERSVKRLEKAGFTVTRMVEDSILNPGTRYERGACGVINGFAVEIYRNGNSDEAALIRVRRLTDHDEPESDYSAGWFTNTLKDAINYAKRTDH